MSSSVSCAKFHQRPSPPAKRQRPPRTFSRPADAATQFPGLLSLCVWLLWATKRRGTGARSKWCHLFRASCHSTLTAASPGPPMLGHSFLIFSHCAHGCYGRRRGAGRALPRSRIPHICFTELIASRVSPLPKVRVSTTRGVLRT